MSGFPLVCLTIRIPCPARQEAAGSHKFLPLLFSHATPPDTGSPSETSPWRFLCVGFRRVKNVADCFDTLVDADMASGRCISPVAYVILCVRFIFLVRACGSLGRLHRSAKNATLDTGGWLDLMKFNPLSFPDRDFHPARSDKLRLSH